MSTTEAITERAEWLAGIREMADFLESHPDVPLPTVYQPAYFYGKEAKAELARVALALGKAEKKVTESFFSLERHFGPIVYEAKAYRDYVCERVVVGTETVTVQVPPEGVEMIETTVEREIVEWVCPPSILAFADDTEAVA